MVALYAKIKHAINNAHYATIMKARQRLHTTIQHCAQYATRYIQEERSHMRKIRIGNKIRTSIEEKLKQRQESNQNQGKAAE